MRPSDRFVENPTGKKQGKLKISQKTPIYTEPPITANKNLLNILNNCTVFIDSILKLKDRSDNKFKNLYDQLKLINKPDSVGTSFCNFLGLDDRRYTRVDTDKLKIYSYRKEIELDSEAKQSELLHSNYKNKTGSTSVGFAEKYWIDKINGTQTNPCNIDKCYGTHYQVNFKECASPNYNFLKNEWEHVFPCVLYACICGLQYNYKGDFMNKLRTCISQNDTSKLTIFQEAGLEGYIFDKLLTIDDSIKKDTIIKMVDVMIQTRKLLLLLSCNLYNQSKCSFKLFTLSRNLTARKWSTFKITINETVLNFVWNSMGGTGTVDVKCRNAPSTEEANVIPDYISKSNLTKDKFRSNLQVLCNDINNYWDKKFNNNLTNGQVLFMASPIFTAVICMNSKSFIDNIKDINTVPIVLLAKKSLQKLNSEFSNNQNGGGGIKRTREYEIEDPRSKTKIIRYDPLEELFDFMEISYVKRVPNFPRPSYWGDYTDFNQDEEIDIYFKEYVGNPSRSLTRGNSVNTSSRELRARAAERRNMGLPATSISKTMDVDTSTTHESSFQPVQNIKRRNYPTTPNTTNIVSSSAPQKRIRRGGKKQVGSGEQYPIMNRGCISNSEPSFSLPESFLNNPLFNLLPDGYDICYQIDIPNDDVIGVHFYLYDSSVPMDNIDIHNAISSVEFGINKMKTGFLWFRTNNTYVAHLYTNSDLVGFDLRGAGIGTFTILCAIAYNKSMGVTDIMLDDASSGFGKPNNIYLKLGFKYIETNRMLGDVNKMFNTIPNFIKNKGELFINKLNQLTDFFDDELWETPDDDMDLSGGKRQIGGVLYDLNLQTIMGKRIILKINDNITIFEIKQLLSEINLIDDKQFDPKYIILLRRGKKLNDQDIITDHYRLGREHKPIYISIDFNRMNKDIQDQENLKLTESIMRLQIAKAFTGPTNRKPEQLNQVANDLLEDVASNINDVNIDQDVADNTVNQFAGKTLKKKKNANKSRKTKKKKKKKKENK